MKKDIYLINPNAANGKGKRVWEKVEIYLNENNANYSSHFTKRQGDATEIVKKLVAKQETIQSLTIIGGDGTVQEAISGLPLEKVNFPISVISGGTGNDFVRTISGEINPIKAIERIRNNGQHKTVDIGTFQLLQNENEGKFVNALGVGLDAEVGKKVNESVYKNLLNALRLGKLSYVFALISLIISYKRKNITIHVDGKSHDFTNVWFITVANGPYYGGGMKISPESSITDGSLDIIIVHNLSRVKLLALFALVFVGKHIKMKEVATLKGQEIKISSEEKSLVHVDGEIVGHTPVSVSVLHKLIKIIV